MQTNSAMTSNSPMLSKIVWLLVAIIGAVALGTIALHRGESINAVWLVAAAVCSYSIAYRYYSLFIAKKVFELNPRRVTPAHRLKDGLDYVPTNKYVLFGHHFAAIAGAGRSYLSGTNGLFARYAMAHYWGGICRCGTRFYCTIYLDPP